MMVRTLCQALLLFAISSGAPALERPATAGVHRVQGRRHHPRKRHRERKRERRQERQQERSGEL
jgi:Ni/Co efflux regulator RcnB